jgi:hypothetical protein
MRAVAGCAAAARPLNLKIDVPLFMGTRLAAYITQGMIV